MPCNCSGPACPCAPPWGLGAIGASRDPLMLPRPITNLPGVGRPGPVGPGPLVPGPWIGPHPTPGPGVGETPLPTPHPVPPKLLELARQMPQGTPPGYNCEALRQAVILRLTAVDSEMIKLVDYWLQLNGDYHYWTHTLTCPAFDAIGHRIADLGVALRQQEQLVADHLGLAHGTVCPRDYSVLLGLLSFATGAAGYAMQYLNWLNKLVNALADAVTACSAAPSEPPFQRLRREFGHESMA